MENVELRINIILSVSLFAREARGAPRVTCRAHVRGMTRSNGRNRKLMALAKVVNAFLPNNSHGGNAQRDKI